MRILHIPERAGRWVEIEWNGQADELMRKREERRVYSIRILEIEHA